MTCLRTDGGTFELVCEPDEYARLVRDVKRSGIVRAHRRGLTSYKAAFTGRDFVTWYTEATGKGACKQRGVCSQQENTYRTL